MTEYIDREAVLLEINRQIRRQFLCIANVETIIKGAPAADVAPVVHSEWRTDEADSGDPEYYSAYIDVHCLECGFTAGLEAGQYDWTYGDPFPWKYCPNCGARMDGEAK